MMFELLFDVMDHFLNTQISFVFMAEASLDSSTQAGSLCYIVLRCVERFVEMLPEGSSARSPLSRDGVSVA